MGMFVEELRAVAGKTIVEKVDPGDHLHALFMGRLDERGRRVEVANDLRIALHPRRALFDEGFRVFDNAGSGIRPDVFRVEAGRVRQFGAVREDSHATAPDEERLTSVFLQLRDQLVDVALGHLVGTKPDLVVHVDVDDQFRRSLFSSKKPRGRNGLPISQGKHEK